MQDNEQYTITVNGNGMSFERQVSREVGEQIVILAVTGSPGSGGRIEQPPANKAQIQDQAISREPEKPVEPAQDPRPERSISEFFNEVGPKRNPDRIAAIGRFLNLYKGKESFDRNDLIEWFQNARQPVPQNITRDVNWTIRSGWIAERHNEKGSYYVTAKGISVVDAKFPKEEIEKTWSSTRKNRRTSPTSQLKSG